MFIEGVGISNYRSFGNYIQRIGPFKKINLFIGQNNSGKSNILRFIKHHYNEGVEAISSKTAMQLNDLDRHRGKNSGNLQFAFGLTISGNKYNQLLRIGPPQTTSLNRLLQSPMMSKGTQMSWFDCQNLSYVALDSELFKEIKNRNVLSDQEWYEIWNNLTGKTGGGLEQHWIPETFDYIVKFLGGSLKVDADLIPAIRRVGEKGAVATDNSGIDLIERLAKLQNPSLQAIEDKKRFEEINEFLRKVTGNSTAQLEIPHDREMILVHMDEKTLPLSSLGTGIHEVIILAAFATVLRDRVLCIEEPELHLHPLLQKKLIRYLESKTDNQYFISTHSAHLLDISNAAIFHVRYIDGVSQVEAVYTDAAKSSICVDLGYRASDLMQANCVIWVEGPSDRIYLNHWIKTLDANLIEGIHYSIMFYGGRLLSHLSANDPEVEDFISLRRLNRFISIVIDSDKRNRQASINDTKKRIRDEFDKGLGFAWVTKGREIENYIESNILEASVKIVHPSASKLANTGQFDHALHFINKKGKPIEEVDKVKIAHEVVKQPANLDILDLKKIVKTLINFIKSANDFDETHF